MLPASPIFNTVESVRLPFNSKILNVHVSAKSVSILLIHFSPMQGKNSFGTHTCVLLKTG